MFPFDNELDLLEIRLETLDPFVDFFVVGESVESFSGIEKELHFESNKEKFSKFSSKIIHSKFTERLNCSSFERDVAQKDFIMRTLAEHCVDSDLLILSDVDEIPRPSSVNFALDFSSDGGVAHFAQDVYFYYLNFLETEGKLLSITGEYPDIRKPKWLGSRSTNFQTLRESSISEIRSSRYVANGLRIDSGGWHFSYCGSHDGADVETRVKRKFDHTAHRELVSDEAYKRAGKRISKGRDPFGRRGPRFKKTEIQMSHFPEVVVTNQERYANMILP